MVKIFCAGLFATALLTSGVRAAAISATEVSVDGCTVLSRIVHAEVLSAAKYGPSRSGPWRIQVGQGDIEVCEHASKTVSRAFTLAWSSAGVDVAWGRGDADEYCRRGFLSRCKPECNPNSVSTFNPASERVMNSWTIVSKAVMSDMYNPFSSDIVSFRYDDLKLRLGLSLRSIGALNDH